MRLRIRSLAAILLIILLTACAPPSLATPNVDSSSRVVLVPFASEMILAP